MAFEISATPSVDGEFPTKMNKQNQLPRTDQWVNLTYFLFTIKFINKKKIIQKYLDNLFIAMFQNNILFKTLSSDF